MKKNWTYFQNKFEYENKIDDTFEGWYGLRRFGYDLASFFKPKTIVELGTYKGTSFFSFCQAIKNEKLKTILYGVDTWEGDQHTGFYGKKIFTDLKKILKSTYPKAKTKLIKKTFDEAVEDFKENSIDLLHIDGLHTYKAVKHDYETWKHTVSDKGIIIFHDIHYKKRGFGVYKFWEELKNKHFTLELKHSNGLGILIKDESLYKKLKPFEESWQAYYSAAAELDKIKNTSGEQEIKLLNMYKKQIKELNQDLEKQIKTIESLKEQLFVIKSSKFFILWQKYCSIRDRF